MSFPSNLKYTKDHEWALIQGNKATIGVTSHAATSLGDIVFVELPSVGRELKKGQTFGVVESIKAVSDLFSPVTGKVLETNGDLANDPAKVNQDPHAGAWMLKVEITDPSSTSDLMDADTYTKYVESLH
jgi:glycine cleavage system H protein